MVKNASSSKVRDDPVRICRLHLGVIHKVSTVTGEAPAEQPSPQPIVGDTVRQITGCSGILRIDIKRSSGVFWN